MKTNTINEQRQKNVGNQKTIYACLRKALSRFRVNVWRLLGDSNENGNLELIYAGKEINKDYIKTVMFDGTCREESLGRFWKYQIRRLTTPATQILITEYDADCDGSNYGPHVFRIPFWLGWTADISGDIEKVLKSDRTLSHDIRKIRNNKLEYEITDCQAEFENFYDTMYLPYIGSRFINTAHFMKRSQMLSQRHQCKLLYVKRGNEALSGMLIRYEPEYPWLWSMGVKHANPDYIKDGAMGALYYFAINYLRECDHGRVSFGATRSFLSDGALQYKKKWPIENAGFTRQGFQVQLTSKSQDLIKMLTSRPFVFVEKDQLYSAVFLGPDDFTCTKDFKKIIKLYDFDKVQKVVLYVFGAKSNDVEPVIPAEYSERFIIRSAEDFFEKPLSVFKRKILIPGRYVKEPNCR